MSKQPEQLIRLEKFSQPCREIISSAQSLADEMRHSKTTLLHLVASFEAFVVTQELLVRTVKGQKRTVSARLVERFLDMLAEHEKKSRSVSYRLANTPTDAATPNSAYLTESFMKLLKFAEKEAGEKQVTVTILLSELLRSLT